MKMGCCHGWVPVAVALVSGCAWAMVANGQQATRVGAEPLLAESFDFDTFWYTPNTLDFYWDHCPAKAGEPGTPAAQVLKTIQRTAEFSLDRSGSLLLWAERLENRQGEQAFPNAWLEEWDEGARRWRRLGNPLCKKGFPGYRDKEDPVNPAWRHHDGPKRLRLVVEQARDRSFRFFKSSIECQVLFVPDEGRKRAELQDILRAYVKFGLSPHTWPDGTTDKMALARAGSFGVAANFLSAMGISDYCRFTCAAMQYKVMWFLNDLKRAGKLDGWEFREVRSAWFLPVLTEHNAVVIWPKGKDWRREGIVLDPHGASAPRHYKESGPSLYPYELADVDTFYYFEGRETPWSQQPEPRQETAVRHPLRHGVGGVGVYLRCPVDVLVVNSKGQRLGVLPGGTAATEFRPLDLSYWRDAGGRHSGSLHCREAITRSRSSGRVLAPSGSSRGFSAGICGATGRVRSLPGSGRV